MYCTAQMHDGQQTAVLDYPCAPQIVNNRPVDTKSISDLGLLRTYHENREMLQGFVPPIFGSKFSPSNDLKPPPTSIGTWRRRASVPEPLGNQGFKRPVRDILIEGVIRQYGP